MKKNISLIIIIGFAIVFGSCKKEGPNIFNMFTDVKVEFSNADPRNIVDYKQVKVGDEVWIDYTITSDKDDMYGVYLLEVGNSTPVLKTVLDPTMRRVATGHIVLNPARTGLISYRIYPVDKIGVYMGDGYKKLTIEVINDLSFVTERYAEIPNPYIKIDSLTGNYNYVYPISIPNYAATAQSFFSLTDAQAYSYTDGAANSAKIDLGIYYKPTVTRTVNATTGVVTITNVAHYYFYSPGVSPSPVPPTLGFNFSGWTAKGTTFSAAQANTVFTGFKTGQQVAAAGAKVAVNLTNPEFVAGSAYYFKTTDGKYGIIWVHDNGFDRTRDRPYANFWIKMQM
ncbi:hypothetical protein KXQ82_19305 [Mucilaginibacter sp. HMF5004]|uniref:hypothetical protein n=1 Tax=Mucilaginibacter rivuli TaxID=2857527 RepID=UPI001C5F7056|nr:hypothetical protein [Mucilaginibacter rivuli]MBW4891880.1 hypothetical protein [Mucilaginibacter rivuli]